MYSEELELVKKYNREQKWNKVISFLEENIDDNEIYPADLYSYYGRSLRKVGNNDKAIELLNKAHKVHPKNERILLELLKLYNQRSEWGKSLSVTKKLIQIKPTNNQYYMMKGQTYSWMGERQNAQKMFEQALSYTHNKPFDEVIIEIQKGFMDIPDANKAKYTLPGGMNNLGMIFHEDQVGKYVTKISRASFNESEKIFYTEILSHYPMLEKVVPQYIDIKILDGLQYLTIEKIHARERIPLNEVIEASQNLSVIKYKSINESFPNSQYSYVLKKRPNFISLFFTQIHKKHYNELLFKELNRVATENNYHKDDIQLLQYMEELVMENELYKHINPDEHYSLIHGDYKPSNLGRLYTGETTIYDWGNFKIGPHFLDMGRYFQATSTPYQKIQESYLYNEDIKKELSPIEKIFFLYSFVLYHYIILDKNNRKKKMTRLILPALMDMEKLVAVFKGRSIYPSKFITSYTINYYKILLNSEERNRSANRKNRNDKKKLERENKALKNELTNTLESKSWKVTLPLRKLTNLFIKKD